MKKVSILLVLIVLAASSAEAVTAQGGSDSVDGEYIAPITRLVRYNQIP